MVIINVGDVVNSDNATKIAFYRWDFQTPYDFDSMGVTEIEAYIEGVDDGVFTKDKITMTDGDISYIGNVISFKFGKFIAPTGVYSIVVKYFTNDSVYGEVIASSNSYTQIKLKLTK